MTEYRPKSHSGFDLSAALKVRFALSNNAAAGMSYEIGSVAGASRKSNPHVWQYESGTSSTLTGLAISRR